jgi:hypothetical protein
MGPDFLVLQSPQGITTMTFSRYLCAAVFASCIYFIGESRAATIDVDTVLGPGHPYRTDTITVVDGDDPPTEVDVLEGAFVGGTPQGGVFPIGFDVYGRSIVSLLGGVVEASEKTVLLHDQSVFHMQSGIISNAPIEARDASKVIIDDGVWHDARAFNSSDLLINGGSSGIFNAEVHAF